MTKDHFNQLLHAWSISTVMVALITLTFGALVTTKNAGMAFPDWPTSDGHLMITYPWLKDYAVNWNKFLEHGHRLAGTLIGMWSIMLVILTFCLDSRRWVRLIAVAILLGVISQGILGGFRVQLNARGLAMLHGIFAAIVFSLMGTMVVITSRRWGEVQASPSLRPMGLVTGMGLTCVGLLSVQYVYGSLIRHQGTGLHEHLGLGILVLLVIIANAWIAGRSDVRWIRRSAVILLCVALGQVALGLTTWVVKYGFTQTGYVAIADSIQQVLSRTAHMVWGVITLTTGVVHAIKVARVASVSPKVAEPLVEIRRASSLSQGGGVS